MPRAFPDTLLGFQAMFTNEAACLAYLEELRWPEGFACPYCRAAGKAQRMRTRPRVLRAARAWWRPR